MIDPLRSLAENPHAVQQSARVDVARLLEAKRDVADLQLVDERQPGETEAGVIEGAVLLPLTMLNEGLGGLDPARPTIIYCAGGFRSSIAASRLVEAGFFDVSDLVADTACGYKRREREQPQPDSETTSLRRS